MVGLPSRLWQSARRSPPLELAASGAKAALRPVGMATTSLRPPPDFLIVGTKRGGTTSLHEYLAEHPAVLPMFPAPNAKGTYFFDEEFERGERWYRSHFPTARTRRRVALRTGDRVVSGESSPYYLFHPLAPERAKALVPGAQIIMLLRDPVARAHSHYRERMRHDTEPLSFVEALDAEEARLAGEEDRIRREPGYKSLAHRHQSYVAQSRYAVPVARWLDAFGDQVLVLRSEDLYDDPQAVYDQVLRHLGLAPRRLADPSPRNAEPGKPLPPEIEHRLRDALADDVAELERLLGRSMDWPS